MEWQKIDTAPKDGRAILCNDARGFMFVAFWSIPWDGWLTTPPRDDGAFGSGKPIVWQPLPEPPQEQL